MSRPVDLSHELEIARRLAQEAAALVRRFAEQPVAVKYKDAGEPVTEADLAANALIVGRLAQEFPDDAILSEELPDDGSRLGRPRVWMVDPIDGTRDFVRGQPGYVVMIGLCVDDRPALGVVAHPSTGVVWSGVVGQGAWRDRTDGTRIPIVTSTLAEPRGVRIVVSQSRRSPQIDAFRLALGVTDEMNVGSVGMKVALVCQGDRDLYLYGGEQTKLWDTCGPEAILTAAGGRMSDMEGRPLVYSKADLNNRDGVVASNGPLHDHVIRALAAARGK
jgi:3''-Phosphoadenosine 5''-phosphosulfate (PAPS) 3''-phosphatase